MTSVVEAATTAFPALGTTATLAVTAVSRIGAAEDMLRTELAEIDAACSRFRPDSEISRLHESAGRESPVSPLLAEALAVALRAAADTGRAATHADHVERYGHLPEISGAALVDLVADAGLLGRGGAWFPTGVKLRAVASGRRPAVVLANGAEGEPASGKDHALLTIAPHLVLDGVALAARAVGADVALLAVRRGAGVLPGLRAALGERPADPVRLVELPARFVASEESALVNFVNSGEARPTATPPRPFERGVRGRRTLVDNVETLANIALIALRRRLVPVHRHAGRARDRRVARRGAGGVGRRGPGGGVRLPDPGPPPGETTSDPPTPPGGMME